MSEENAERARRFYEAFNRVGLDAISDEHLHEDVVVVEPPDLPDAAETQGLKAARAGLAKFVDMFDAVTVAVDDVVVKGERTLTRISVTAAGKGSGASVDVVRFDIATWRDGRMARLDLFFDGERAASAFENEAS